MYVRLYPYIRNTHPVGRGGGGGGQGQEEARQHGHVLGRQVLREDGALQRLLCFFWGGGGLRVW